MLPLDHDERVIDESLEETFPASDPPTPAQPGSLVGQHYARTASVRWSGIGAGVGLLAVCAAIAFGSRRQA